MSSKRVILRAHEHWLDQYLLIADSWLTTHGYSSVNNSEDGQAKHNVRACHIGNDRFHIIMDLNVNETPKPVNQLYQIEMYRVYRGTDGSRMWV
jgi:hypothetical protein